MALESSMEHSKAWNDAKSALSVVVEVGEGGGVARGGRCVYQALDSGLGSVNL